MKSKVVTVARKVFIFEGMDDSTIGKYLKDCSERIFEACDVIHSVSSPLCGIGAVVSGRAKIVSGGGTLLRLLRAGDSFGAASLFDSNNGNRTEVICTSACRVLVIPEEVILRVIADDPAAAVRYISFLSGRIGFLNARIGALSAGDAITKVSGYLLSLDVDGDGMAVLGQHLTNIASGLNMSRASLYRTLDRFTELGFIRRCEGNVMILNRDELESLAYKKKR